jgi:hypothetical protein
LSFQLNDKRTKTENTVSHLNKNFHLQNKKNKKNNYENLNFPYLSSASFSDFNFLDTKPIIQTKLKVSRTGDEHEREADRIAEQIMRMSEPEKSHLSMKNSNDDTKKLDRKCKSCEEEEEKEKILKNVKISRKENDSSSNQLDISDNVVKYVNDISQQGSPLDSSTREFMESRFNYDFANVRIHTDERSAMLANTINALAYTVGHDIMFRNGQFKTNTREGRQLLAHELTHVIQQSTDLTEQNQTSNQGTIFRQKASWGEKWGALWGAGPYDAYRGGELAQEALKAAKQTGLPGLLNGPADAWRHCYWNCRMVEEINEEDAEDISANHEKHGFSSTAELMMDTWNNKEGRKCSPDCDLCCQSKLDAGKLFIVEGGKVGASKPTPRPIPAAGSKIDRY